MKRLVILGGILVLSFGLLVYVSHLKAQTGDPLGGNLLGTAAAVLATQGTVSRPSDVDLGVSDRVTSLENRINEHLLNSDARFNDHEKRIARLEVKTTR